MSQDYCKPGKSRSYKLAGQWISQDYCKPGKSRSYKLAGQWIGFELEEPSRIAPQKSEITLKNPALFYVQINMQTVLKNVYDYYYSFRCRYFLHCSQAELASLRTKIVWNKVCTQVKGVGGRQILLLELAGFYLGLARAIYIRCMYGAFGRKINKFTVIYGAYIRFWPTLVIY